MLAQLNVQLVNLTLLLALFVLLVDISIIMTVFSFALIVMSHKNLLKLVSLITIELLMFQLKEDNKDMLLLLLNGHANKPHALKHQIHVLLPMEDFNVVPKEVLCKVKLQTNLWELKVVFSNIMEKFMELLKFLVL